jgi:DNA-binding transcriptional LysR family regulator
MLMEITYDYYRIFYYAAQYHSFTRAARAMHNSQPNITRCMNALEQQLGCTLFVRSNKGTKLTPEGRRLYAHVSIAYEQLLAGQQELAGEHSMKHGLVSIAASETALHLLLLKQLQRFHRQYPGIRLRISNHSTPQAVAALQNGLADFAVVTTPADVRKPLNEGILYSFREVLIGGPQYAELAKKPHSLRDLLDCPFICLGEGTGTRELYRHWFAEYGLPLQADVEAATMDQVLPMVQYDLGIGFYPAELAEPEIAQKRIVQIPLTEPVPTRSVCLIEDTARPLSMAAKALKQMLPEEH